jgi:tetratricopeptide (TPR) repeat protein
VSSSVAALESFREAIDFQKQGKFEEARDAYLHAIELDPGFCDAMDNLGLLLRRQGDLDGAIYWYQRSIEVFPENSVAHQNLAFVYRRQGRYEEALAEYQILREIEPQNPEGYFGAGQVYIYMGRPADAIPLLKVAEDIYSSSDAYPVEYLRDTQYIWLRPISSRASTNCAGTMPSRSTRFWKQMIGSTTCSA